MKQPTKLTVVAGHPPAPQMEKLADRVRRLQAEARGLARDHVITLIGRLGEVMALAADIAEGGEAYPPGVRDLARRLVEEADAKASTLEAIVSRS